MSKYEGITEVDCKECCDTGMAEGKYNVFCSCHAGECCQKRYDRFNEKHDKSKMVREELIKDFNEGFMKE